MIDEVLSRAHLGKLPITAFHRAYGGTRPALRVATARVEEERMTASDAQGSRVATTVAGEGLTKLSAMPLLLDE